MHDDFRRAAALWSGRDEPRGPISRRSAREGASAFLRVSAVIETLYAPSAFRGASLLPHSTSIVIERSTAEIEFEVESRTFPSTRGLLDR